MAPKRSPAASKVAPSKRPKTENPAPAAAKAKAAARSKAASAPKAAAAPNAAKESTAKAGPLKVNDVRPGRPPLEGVVLVFTGELDQISRPEAEEKAKAAGAKVMSGVSGNTSYLVLGSHLDDGRKVEETSKYRKYLELKEKGKNCPELLDEAQFLALLPNKPAVPAPPVPARARPGAESQRMSDDAAAAPAERHDNWVDVHAPKTFDALLGNAGPVRKLTQWLRDWDDVVLRGRKKFAPFKPGGGMPDNVNARAALISGPPGIGKTTAARLVAQLHGGFDVQEYNASDARGQKVIQNMAAGIADNRTLNFGSGSTSAGRSLGEAKVQGFTRRVVIIMDEVDGMGGGDRGGMPALTKMIKKTRNPIICICNDGSSPKVRSLAFSCYDIKFARPPKGVIAGRVEQICTAEGLEVEPNALEMLAESCGNDMRLVLNQMQLLAMSPEYADHGVTYTDMKGRLHGMGKDQDVMLSPFDASRKLLTSSECARMSMNERLDMFFVDHQLVGLMVQENYLKAVEKKKPEHEVLNKAAQSAELMAFGDVLNGRLRDNQEWGLLPHVGFLTAVYPATISNGFVAFPSFPAFLGKYSAMSRMRRLAQELHAHIRLSGSVPSHGLQTSGFASLLYEKAMRPLLQENTELVSEAAEALDAYGLRREHLSEHLTELRTHLGEDDLFKLVDAKVKAAMTREMNSGGYAPKVVIPASKKRKTFPAQALDPEEVEGEGAGTVGEEVEEEKDEDTFAGGLVKIKGKAKGKAKVKAKPKELAKTKVVDDGKEGKADKLGQVTAKSKAPSLKASTPGKAEAKGKAAVPRSKAIVTAPKAKGKAKAKAKGKSR